MARAGLDAPDGFSLVFVFRRCVACDAINVVKQNIFECGVCSTPLLARWNCDSED